MKKIWKIIKETATTVTGILSMFISFMLISGIPIIIIGHIFNKPIVFGIGYSVFAFYLAPNGVAIFSFVVLSPLINKLINKLIHWRKKRGEDNSREEDQSR